MKYASEWQTIAYHQKKIILTLNSITHKGIWFRVLDRKNAHLSATPLYHLIGAHTLVESSNIFVCSAMKRTQKQDLCTSGGQVECENAGFRSTGLLLLSDSSSADSDCSTTAGPWIWQLPLSGPPSIKLHMDIIIMPDIMTNSQVNNSISSHTT